MEAEEKRNAGLPYARREDRPEGNFRKPGAGNFSDRPERRFDKTGFGAGSKPEGRFRKPEASGSDRPERRFDKPGFGAGNKPEGRFRKPEASGPGGDRPERRFDKPGFGAGSKPEGRFRKPESGESGERREFRKDGPGKEDQSRRFDRDKKPFGDRSNARPGFKKSPAGGSFAPTKNRLGIQSPEQVKEFRRKGNSVPEYDEKKMASIAGNRGRRPVGRKSEGRKAPNEEGLLIRLNRYIAQSGLCSRREADDLISTGQITVNGKVMDQMGYLVKSDDVVKYGRRLLNKEKLVYVLLNKPKDFLTTTEDPEERKTVMTLVENACKERIYPVGRLDRNTTGLLLITNDGELSERMMHPSHNVRKIYQVDLDKPLTAADEAAIRAGIELEDGKAPVDELEVLSKERDIVGLSIHIGRNRIVRRIFESLGYKVVRLDRVMYAGLTKKDLPRGTWRYLTEKEVINLKYFS
jgi:23S rRNA pseudouridine2605 synthase